MGDLPDGMYNILSKDNVSKTDTGISICALCTGSNEPKYKPNFLFLISYNSLTSYNIL